VNALLLGQIQQIFNLDGFTGKKTLGSRKGGQVAVAQESDDVGHYDHGGNNDDEGEYTNDLADGQIDGILDFVASL
jgi:hypothetical protein